VETPRLAVGPARETIRSQLALVINDEERWFDASGSHGGEEELGLTLSHLQAKAQPVHRAGIELRLRDGPSLVNERSQIADGVVAGH
jgi:hypothetical protein